MPVIGTTVVQLAKPTTKPQYPTLDELVHNFAELNSADANFAHIREQLGI